MSLVHTSLEDFENGDLAPSTIRPRNCIVTKFDCDVIAFKVFSSTLKRKAGVFKLLQFKERFRVEGINTVFMSVQVVKAVQTFEATRYFILLSVVQGACSRIAVYVSKCVDQEEFCDGRT